MLHLALIYKELYFPYCCPHISLREILLEYSTICFDLYHPELCYLPQIPDHVWLISKPTNTSAAKQGLCEVIPRVFFPIVVIKKKNNRQLQINSVTMQEFKRHQFTHISSMCTALSCTKLRPLVSESAWLSIQHDTKSISTALNILKFWPQYAFCVWQMCVFQIPSENQFLLTAL